MRGAEMNDPHGYDRLARALDFLVAELRAAQLDSSGLERARRFQTGSPSEFLGESLLALEAVLRNVDYLPPSVAAFIEALASEIRLGFERVGGG